MSGEFRQRVMHTHDYEVVWADGGDTEVITSDDIILYIRSDRDCREVKTVRVLNACPSDEDAS